MAGWGWGIWPRRLGAGISPPPARLSGQRIRKHEMGRAVPHGPTSPPWVVTSREEGGALSHRVNLIHTSFQDPLASILSAEDSAVRRKQLRSTKFSLLQRKSPLHASHTILSLLGVCPLTLLPDTSSCCHPAGWREWWGFKGETPRAALPKPTVNMPSHVVPQRQLLHNFLGSEEAGGPQRDDRESEGCRKKSF